jgi:hypothetical protein
MAILKQITRSVSITCVIALNLLGLGHVYGNPNSSVIIRFSESRIDGLYTNKNVQSGDVSRYVNTTHRSHFVIEVPIASIVPFSTGTGAIACEVGGFFHSAFLSEDPKFKVGKSTSVSFPLYDGVTFDTNGNPIATGKITYNWSSKTVLIITMSGENVGSLVEDTPYTSGLAPSYTVVSSTTVLSATDSSGDVSTTGSNVMVTGTGSSVSGTSSTTTNQSVVTGTSSSFEPRMSEYAAIVSFRRCSRNGAHHGTTCCRALRQGRSLPTSSRISPRSGNTGAKA